MGIIRCPELDSGVHFHGWVIGRLYQLFNPCTCCILPPSEVSEEGGIATPSRLAPNWRRALEWKTACCSSQELTINANLNDLRSPGHLPGQVKDHMFAVTVHWPSWRIFSAIDNYFGFKTLKSILKNVQKTLSLRFIYNNGKGSWWCGVKGQRSLTSKIET